MSVPEIIKNGGTLMKAMIENEEISSAIAETIKENKGKIVTGGLVLGGLYVMKDTIKDIAKDRKIKFRKGDFEFEIE